MGPGSPGLTFVRDAPGPLASRWPEPLPLARTDARTRSPRVRRKASPERAPSAHFFPCPYLRTALYLTHARRRTPTAQGQQAGHSHRHAP
jgi:hypothetical protein